MAVCMALSLAMPIFAANYSEPVTLGLYVKGDPDDQVVVTSSGTYTLTFESESASSYDWIVLKNVAGADQATSIPQGTEINVTELLIDGISHTFDGGKSTYNDVVGENGAIELLVYLGPWGINHIDNNPYSASKVEMTLCFPQTMMRTRNILFCMHFTAIGETKIRFLMRQVMLPLCSSRSLVMLFPAVKLRK